MTVDTSSEASSFPVSLLQDEDEAAQRRGVFFFINPDSGSNDGLRLIQAGVNHLVLSAPEICEVFIFDIRDGQSGNKKGFHRLAAALSNPRRKHEADAFVDTSFPDHSRFQFSVICVGGDGTVIWCITEMMKHNINLSKVAFGVIPYGTEAKFFIFALEKAIYKFFYSSICCSSSHTIHFSGNDFAIAFGWKNFTLNDPFGRSLKVLRNLIAVIFSSKVVSHDLWNINVEINATGQFSKIDSKSRQNILGLSENWVFSLHFAWLFNWKAVVVNWDESVYILMPSIFLFLCALKFILFHPVSTKDLNVVLVEDQKEKKLTFLMGNYFSIGIESRIGRGFDRNRAHNRFLNKMMYAFEGIKKTFKRNLRADHFIDSLIETHDTEIVIFSTQRTSHNPVLKKAVSLVALNVPSFSAGNDAWKSSRSVGLKFPDKPSMKNSALLSLPQKTGDGLLEFLSFSRVADLGLEFVFKGQGKRIHQGGGPYILRFRDISPEQRVYFQVDGEFYRMTQPKFASIDRFVKIFVLVPSGN
ncbi:diacylglycerol kinase accessory domain (presumed) domain-containing protein [Cardiosporidium cionae]|uniref:diacylglycerol kinase (ATP) n=1 Tax=Cardiosporidium cionae TaxID=476202 RepID=A0ABQ7JE76_9APIC|nr:diacylglycerol kinase accessory domain (presumed) domain-containing protein [Cardiosporidium cionae]|eukprot:KAF8822274.1 diacylglycerol kinase accessory domain (presumed) domain-containing protein [Cardiosporidium cionae]